MLVDFAVKITCCLCLLVDLVTEIIEDLAFFGISLELLACEERDGFAFTSPGHISGARQPVDNPDTNMIKITHLSTFMSLSFEGQQGNVPLVGQVPRHT